MPIENQDGYLTAGGPAQPVTIVNASLPGTASGSSSAVTVADGADGALGAKADAPASSNTGTFSLIALTKRLLGKFADLITPAAGLSASLVAGTYLEVAATAVANGTMTTTDAGPYPHVNVHCIDPSTNGIIAFQASNDGTNYVTFPLTLVSNGTTSTGAYATGQLFAGLVPGRYFRTVLSGRTGGTASIVVTFSAAPRQVQTTNLAAIGTTALSASGVNTDGLLNINGLVGTNTIRGYNGTSADVFRTNHELTLLASAARTATTNSSDQTNYNGSRLQIFANVSAISGASVTPSLQVKDSISGNYKTVWTAAAAITATGQYTYVFAPGGAGGSNTEVIAAGLTARTFRVVMTHLDTNSITYSVSGVVSL